MSDNLKSAYLNPQSNAAAALNLSAPDLTRHPPRSPRVRLIRHQGVDVTEERILMLGQQKDERLGRVRGGVHGLICIPRENARSAKKSAQSLIRIWNKL